MRSLVSYLNEKDNREQHLRQIGETWNAVLTDRLFSGNAFELSQEMQSEFLQRRLLEKLESNLLEVLARFLTQPDYTIDPAHQETEFANKVRSLQEMGLVFSDRARRDPTDPPAPPPPPKNRGGWGGYNPRPSVDDGLKPVWIVPRELGRPLSRLVPEKLASNRGQPQGVPLSRQPLAALVGRLEPELLELQAERWGVLTLVGQVEPPELAQELSRAMSESRQQEVVRANLSDGSQTLFRQIVEGGGRTTFTKLLAEYVSLRRLSRDLRPLTESLVVWEVFENGQSVVFVPPEIAAPRTSPAPARLPLQTVTPPANPTLGPEYALAWDTLTFLNYIVINTVELTANGYIPKRDLKKLFPQLWPWPPETQENRFTYLINLARRLELYKLDETDRLTTSSGLADWLKLDFFAQMRRNVQYWQQEGWRYSPVSFPYYYARQNAVMKANETMLSWLADCEVGQWYDLNSLLQKIQREDPYFIMSRQEVLNQVGRHQLTEMSKMWPRLEGEVIHQTFNTAFEWLGIVRVGREAGRVTAFQLTEFGASISGKAGAALPVAPVSPKPILVQPDFEILLLAPQVETIWQLEKFTTLRKLDLVSLYTLNREALLRGLESGLLLNELSDWLEQSNAQPLPQNLSVSLADWSKGFKQVRLDNVTLLEVSDSAVLDELLRTKQYADYVVRRLSPTAAIVNLPNTQNNRRINPLKTFKATLKKGGFFAD